MKQKNTPHYHHILIFLFFVGYSHAQEEVPDIFQEPIDTVEMLQAQEQDYLDMDSKFLPVVKEYQTNEDFEFKMLGNVSFQNFYGFWIL